MKGTTMAPATVDPWPSWFTRLGFPEMWNPFGEQHMKVEEYREDGTLVVRAELPGVDVDDVEITVSDGVLRIHAERTEESKDEEKDHYRSEFHYGSFTRTLALPLGAHEEEVSASYDDGILEVRVPLSEERASPRKVAVTRR